MSPPSAQELSDSVVEHIGLIFTSILVVVVTIRFLHRVWMMLSATKTTPVVPVDSASVAAKQTQVRSHMAAKEANRQHNIAQQEEMTRLERLRASIHDEDIRSYGSVGRRLDGAAASDSLADLRIRALANAGRVAPAPPPKPDCGQPLSPP
eukprot:TRINITY_DN23249_c0_g1_i1.p1 TRINITY_DN23249_c0_g1~~TRINITY_DN23249_c0_g1_i1.p1  ORF type:complete len:151 (+),score=13.09 TRINITY_DN23249_c0_g1_i1:112-564(+)